MKRRHTHGYRMLAAVNLIETAEDDPLTDHAHLVDSALLVLV